MAVKFPFVTALICEHILEETSGVISAIRIVDIFQVPDGAPPQGAVVHFWVLVTLKTVRVQQEEFRVGLTLVYTSAEREKMATQPGPLKLFRRFADDPSMPGGLTVKIQMNVTPKKMGTHYIEVDVDGELVTTVPFTM